MIYIVCSTLWQALQVTNSEISGISLTLTTQCIYNLLCMYFLWDVLTLPIGHGKRYNWGMQRPITCCRFIMLKKLQKAICSHICCGKLTHSLHLCKLHKLGWNNLTRFHFFDDCIVTRWDKLHLKDRNHCSALHLPVSHGHTPNTATFIAWDVKVLPFTVGIKGYIYILAIESKTTTALVVSILFNVVLVDI